MIIQVESYSFAIKPKLIASVAFVTATIAGSCIAAIHQVLDLNLFQADHLQNKEAQVYL